MLAEGRVLPHLRIATVGGTSFALNQLGGRPAVIFLWAGRHPSLEALRERARPDGPHVATIAVEARGPGVAMKHVPRGASSWHLLIDTCALVSRVWGIKRLPVTLLVDAEGRLVRRAELPDDALWAEAENLPFAPAPVPWPRAPSLEACPTEVELRVQGCGIFLSRKRVADAADSLRAALKLDPENEIVRAQIDVLVGSRQ